MKNSPLSLLFLVIFIDLLGFGLVIPILPNYIAKMTGSEVMVGFAVAIFALMTFFSTPFLGGLSDRIGRRPVLLITIGANALGYILMAIAGDIWTLLLARAVSGIASGNISVAQAYIIDVTPPEKRSKSMGLIGAAFGLGFIFGPPVGGLIMGWFNFAAVGYFAAALCLLNLIPAYFFLKESIAEKVPDAALKLIPLKDYIEVFKNGPIWRLFMINFLYVTGFFLFQVCATLFWEEHFGLDETQRGYAFAFIGISTAFVQSSLIGPLSSRFGERKLLLFGNFGMAIILPALGLVPTGLFLAMEIPLLFMLAIVNGPVGPSSLSLLSQNTDPKRQGKVVGLYQSFSSLARVIGPLIGTSLYAIHYILPFIGAGVLLVINGFFAIGVTRKLNSANQ